METCVVNNIDDLINELDGIMKTNQGFDALKVAFLKKSSTSISWTTTTMPTCWRVKVQQAVRFSSWKDYSKFVIIHFKWWKPEDYLMGKVFSRAL